MCIVGSVGIDTVETSRARVCDVVGGSAIYASFAASRFGKVHLIGVAGGDFPSSICQTLDQQQIDLTGLDIQPDLRTFRWHGRYHDDMNIRDTISVELNALASFRPRLHDAARKAPYIFLANQHPDTQLAVLDQLEGEPFVVADSMDHWIHDHRPALDQVLARVHAVLLNDSEARLLTAQTHPIDAAEAVLKLGPRIVVIKKGEHGSLLVARAMDPVQLPAFPTRMVVDPTGAGDSFAGGFLGAIAQAGTTSSESLKRALAAATITASFTVEGFGLEGLQQANPPSWQRRMDSYRTMLQC